MKYLKAPILLAIASLVQNLNLCSSQDSAVTVSFTIITETEQCDDTGLLDVAAGVVVQYRTTDDQDTRPSESEWKRIDVISINGTCNRAFSYHLELEQERQELLQLRLLQWEHGGGFCNCWGVMEDSLLVRHAAYSTTLNLT